MHQLAPEPRGPHELPIGGHRAVPGRVHLRHYGYVAGLLAGQLRRRRGGRRSELGQRERVRALLLVRLRGCRQRHGLQLHSVRQRSVAGQMRLDRQRSGPSDPGGVQPGLAGRWRGLREVNRYAGIMPERITGEEQTQAVSSEAFSHPSVLPGASTPPRHVFGGRYEILGLVGSGGMGTVYRARDRELDEVVALKLLRRDLVDHPTMLDRFRQEVKLARRVTHRYVARTFDIGEGDGEKFLTMEFVEGEALSARIAREGALAICFVMEVANGMCAGLMAAHAAGIAQPRPERSRARGPVGGRTCDAGLVHHAPTRILTTTMRRWG